MIKFKWDYDLSKEFVLTILKRTMKSQVSGGVVYKTFDKMIKWIEAGEVNIEQYDDVMFDIFQLAKTQYSSDNYIYKVYLITQSIIADTIFVDR